jgi:LDH2 family malate/lactate/ureidoglycolate dehydrogenase
LSEPVVISREDAHRLARRACLATGASEATATSLADATVSAELHGHSNVGFPHLVDYLSSFVEGRINPAAEPTLTRLFPAFISGDANHGIAQLGFDQAFEELVTAARTYGIAIFCQKNSYPVGELGFYTRRLAERGLVAIAVSNADAMLASGRGGRAVFGTNPFSLGFPLAPRRPPVVIDQASSVTAFVNIVKAANAGEQIPVGWAVDADGNDAIDPCKALTGAMLPFGGPKGGNVALMVELLAAGLQGGAWSLDIPSFTSGDQLATANLTIIAIAREDADGSDLQSVTSQIERLRSLGVYIPGLRGPERSDAFEQTVTIPASVHAAIASYVLSAGDHDTRNSALR